MGLKNIFTEHSLFGFADAAGVNLNKLIKCILSQCDATIAVSQATKVNLTLRAAVRLDKIFVIPNAIDASSFTPDPSLQKPQNTINIVVLSRQTYRKGTDLLVDIIPEIVRKHPNVRFIIGGTGDKMKILKEMIEKYNLADKVELLGLIEHSKVRNVLCRGQIFLNTSLTESFCIALLEAASCGLLCVSTNVGGIPEVIPPHMVRLAQAKAKPMIEELTQAIQFAMENGVNYEQNHDYVKTLYSW